MDTLQTLGSFFRGAAKAGTGFDDRLAPYSGPVSDPGSPQPIAQRRSDWKRTVLALGVAAVSDVLGWGVDFIPPLQWLLDATTALLLFLILGRRWAILPGLVAEAIPGMGVFPVWILVVLSVVFYDDIRKRKA